jgi:hypothetical protein
MMSDLIEGTLVYTVPTEKTIHPHSLALYIGDEKVVLSSYIKGWTIADLKDLDKYKLWGESNVSHIYYDDLDSITGYDYAAYDNGKKTELQIRKINGNWEIENDFDMPSWVKVKKKKVSIDHDEFDSAEE